VSDDHESLVRAAYAAFGRGDVTAMMEYVHPDLEWTFLDPSAADPQPQTCHGRGQLQQTLERQAGQHQESVVEEVASRGDKVMVVVHTPGLDRRRRAWAGQDRNFMVLTVRDGQITALRACRDRDEARGFAGLS
jgi:ketosteroid isomerase-like protein